MRTVVTNNSGVAKHFSFLPPHGHTLAIGQALTLDGDLRTVLATGRGRYSRKSELASLTAAEESGDLIISDVPDASSSSSL